MQQAASPAADSRCSFTRSTPSCTQWQSTTGRARLAPWCTARPVQLVQTPRVARHAMQQQAGCEGLHSKSAHDPSLAPRTLRPPPLLQWLRRPCGRPPHTTQTGPVAPAHHRLLLPSCWPGLLWVRWFKSGRVWWEPAQPAQHRAAASSTQAAPGFSERLGMACQLRWAPWRWGSPGRACTGDARMPRPPAGEAEG